MKAAALLAFIALAVPAAGQSTGGTIAGVVTDASGARVTGATVTVTNVANGRSQTLTAGEQGEFRVVALQPAPYRLVVESPGVRARGARPGAECWVPGNSRVRLTVLVCERPLRWLQHPGVRGTRSTARRRPVGAGLARTAAAVPTTGLSRRNRIRRKIASLEPAQPHRLSATCGKSEPKMKGWWT